MLTEAANRPYRWAYTAGMLWEDSIGSRCSPFCRRPTLASPTHESVNWIPQMAERIRKAQRILQGVEEEAEGKEQEPAEVEPLVMLSHRGAAGDVEFDPGEESLGTMVWLGLSGPSLTR